MVEPPLSHLRMDHCLSHSNERNCKLRQGCLFTALFPYLVLTIFFFRGITLKGASEGLIHMFTPKMEMLLKPTVWLDAANQVFYSFGLAFGSIISFGSYNNPEKNCVKDVIIISICNGFTAIYACAVIFAIP